MDLGKRTVRALRGWDNTVTVTLPRDIGTMAAEMVFRPEGTENRVAYIGSDTISYRQLADLLDDVLGTKLKREEWDMGFLRNRLDRKPDNLWVQYQNIFAKGAGVSWAQEGTLNYKRGISLTNIRSYVEENKEAFVKDLAMGG